jgi:hypothetical protein
MSVNYSITLTIDEIDAVFSLSEIAVSNLPEGFLVSDSILVNFTELLLAEQSQHMNDETITVTLDKTSLCNVMMLIDGFLLGTLAYKVPHNTFTTLDKVAAKIFKLLGFEEDTNKVKEVQDYLSKFLKTEEE